MDYENVSKTKFAQLFQPEIITVVGSDYAKIQTALSSDNSDKSTENYQLTLPLSMREHVSVFWLIVLVLQSVT